jgi:hypothetical protein
MALIDGGRRLERTLTAYRGRYFRPGRQLPNGIITEWLLREGAEEKIHKLLEDICLSMETKGRVELPPVTYNEITVEMPQNVKRVYRDMKQDLVANLDILGGEVHTAKNAAALTNKLQQISAGFMYVDDADIREGRYDILHREKIKAVQEVVDGTGSPVLVFYIYRAEYDMLKEAFGSLAHDIKTPGVIDEWNEGRVPVLLAHPASAGHGLNLQHGGHTIVWTTPSWDLEYWEQGNKRLDRQNQKNPVVIHTIITKRTVDKMVYARLTEKASVQQALRDHLESPI